jgi:hypothetical protein
MRTDPHRRFQGDKHWTPIRGVVIPDWQAIFIIQAKHLPTSNVRQLICLPHPIVVQYLSSPTIIEDHQLSPPSHSPAALDSYGVVNVIDEFVTILTPIVALSRITIE